MLWPLYRWYKVGAFSPRRIELILANTLLLFALTIFQALLVSSDMKGSIGFSVVAFVTPFIGLVGAWIFWSILTIVSLVIVLDVDVNNMQEFKERFTKKKAVKPQSKALVEVSKEEDLEKELKEILEVSDDVSSEFEVTKPQEESVAQKEEDLYTLEPVVEEENDLVEEFRAKMQEEKSTQEEVKALTPIEEVQTEKKPESIEAKQEVLEEVIVEELKEEEPVSAPFEVKEELAEEEVRVIERKPEVKKHKHVAIVNEVEENAKLLDMLDKGVQEKPKDFKLPSTDFLARPPQEGKHEINEAVIDAKIEDLIEKLRHFRIEGDVVRTYAGPVVTTFEFKPAANIKVSKILNLQDDLAMALRAQTIRIQAPVPGKDVVGIEIPNEKLETIYLREILESKLFQESSSPLTIALGKDIVGKSFVTDLKKLPHLLIAGTTGSGKSVGINAMILSLLYRNSPDKLKLLMIDPKMLEFSIYNDIPHLLTPVITKAKQAIVALNNMVLEMERRYALLSESRTKNIDNYNEKAKKMGWDELPFIVVVIDELADLMMTSGKEVEHSIGRLAQMARASGIHLIVATQRPSVDVVTGLIKANLPSRVSYKVGQKIDSKVILDAMGAESLLGRGDMLFTPPGMSGLIRLHAPWSSEEEIESIVEYLKEQREVEYDKQFLQEDNDLADNGSGELNEAEKDDLYEQAKTIVLTEQKTSISYLQRRLQIGYNRSARIIEQLEQGGILSAPNAKGNREIL